MFKIIAHVLLNEQLCAITCPMRIRPSRALTLNVCLLYASVHKCICMHKFRRTRRCRKIRLRICVCDVDDISKHNHCVCVCCWCAHADSTRHECDNAFAAFSIVCAMCAKQSLHTHTHNTHTECNDDNDKPSTATDAKPSPIISFHSNNSASALSATQNKHAQFCAKIHPPFKLEFPIGRARGGEQFGRSHRMLLQCAAERPASDCTNAIHIC